MTDRERIGNIIKKKRVLLGMTQDELARKVGYSARTSINRIEKGLCDIPKNKIEILAKVLNCNIDDIINCNTENIFKDTSNNNKSIADLQNNIDIYSCPKPLSILQTNNNVMDYEKFLLWKEYIQDFRELEIQLLETKYKIIEKNNAYSILFDLLDRINSKIKSSEMPALVSQIEKDRKETSTINELIERLENLLESL